MANRNRKDLNASLFKRLIDQAMRHDTDVDNVDAARWIRRHDAADAELMTRADTEGVILSRTARVLKIAHDGRLQYVFFGFPRYRDEMIGLREIDLTPALFTLAVEELDIKSNAYGSTIRNALEGRYFGADSYDGHDLDDIATLFPPLLCLEANPAANFTLNPIRTIGSYAAQTYEDGALSISFDTRGSLVQLFERGNKWIPFELVLQGIMAFSWQSFYLEIYRCIEKLYSLPRLLELSGKWPSQIALHDTAQLLDAILSWRPREEDALVGILKLCSPQCVENLLNSFNLRLESNSDKHAVVARAIYAARNELVHYRPSVSSSGVDDQSWDKRVGALVACVEDIYSLHGDTFHEVKVMANERSLLVTG